MKYAAHKISTNVLVFLLSILALVVSTNDLAFSSPAGQSAGYSFHINNSIYISRAMNTDLERIFSASDNLKIRAHKLAPNGLYFAVRARNLERQYPIEHEPSVRYGEDLLILDSRGEILQKIEVDLIVDLAWDSQGERVVYLTGSYERSRKLTDSPIGHVLSMFDITTGEKRQLIAAEANEVFLNAAWANYDGNIYLKKRVSREFEGHEGVFKYDLASAKLTPTILKSVNLSPRGRYCFLDSDVGNAGAELYDTSSDREVELVVPTKMKQSWIDHPDIMFLSSLTLIDWMKLGSKTYAIVCNQGIDGALQRLQISGFWQLDCESGLLTELSAPKGISPTPGISGYQAPAGLRDGIIVWALPDSKGGYKASIANK